MSRGIYVALSGAVAQENALESTAQNLANAATPGYQKSRAVFREVLAGADTAPRGANPKTGRLHYAAVSGSGVDGSRGAIRSTGRALDIALPENVYLAVNTSRGERLTRAGSLTMTADGALRTAGGATLAKDDGKPLMLDPSAGEPVIGADGSITQNGTSVGKLRLVGAEAASLTHEGGGLLVTNATPAIAKDAVLEIGSIEESNATPMAAMTELVTATRTFEAFQRMIDTFGEIDRRVLTTVPGASE
jgi:flagellar basal-body rod protein FlgF